MPRSDTPSPASDRLMAEVVRQMVDSAPPAPTWDELVVAGSHHEAPVGPVRRSPRVLAAAAAVVAVLVTGLWLLARASPDLELPADRTPSVTLDTVPPALTRATWLAGATAPAVQDCVAKAVADIVVAQDLRDFEGREDLPGYDPTLAELSILNGPLNQWSGVAAHPSTPRERSVELDRLLAAHRSAMAGYNATDPVTTQPGFGAELDEVRRLTAAESAARDPARCWLDTVEGQRVVGAEVDALGGRSAAACLTAFALDDLLRRIEEEPTAEDLAMTDDVNAAVFSWFERIAPPDLPELSVAVDAVRTAQLDEAVELAVAARVVLADVVASTPCRSSAVITSNPTRTEGQP